MNPLNEQLWPVQEPTRGFAERTVEAMLSTVTVARPHRPRSRTILYLSMAALFAAGSAWALIEARGRWQSRLEPPTDVAMAPSVPSIALRVQPTAINSNVTAAAAARARRTTPAARATKLPPAPSSKVQYPPRNPACQCERGFGDFICDCY